MCPPTNVGGREDPSGSTTCPRVHAASVRNAPAAFKRGCPCAAKTAWAPVIEQLRVADLGHRPLRPRPRPKQRPKLRPRPAAGLRP